MKTFKKLSVVSVAILMLAGCGTSFEEKAAIKSRVVMSCQKAGLIFNCTYGSCACEPVQEHCRLQCKSLFRDATKTWGADGGQENFGKSLNTCFNNCLVINGAFQTKNPAPTPPPAE